MFESRGIDNITMLGRTWLIWFFPIFSSLTPRDGITGRSGCAWWRSTPLFTTFWPRLGLWTTTGNPTSTAQSATLKPGVCRGDRGNSQGFGLPEIPPFLSGLLPRLIQVYIWAYCAMNRENICNGSKCKVGKPNRAFSCLEIGHLFFRSQFPFLSQIDLLYYYDLPKKAYSESLFS